MPNIPEFGSRKTEEGFRALLAMSTYHQIKDGTAYPAVLLTHGVNDPRVPFSEARQIAENVRSQGRPVWTVYAENEGHGFGKKDNADYVRAVQVMFLKQHLGAE